VLVNSGTRRRLATISPEFCACADGKFFFDDGADKLCEVCPTSSGGVATTSVAGANNAVTGCKCLANDFMEVSGATGTCKTCQDDTVSPSGSVGIASCQCEANTWLSGTNPSTCSQCPERAISDQNSNEREDCKCPANSFLGKDVEGDDECTTCPNQRQTLGTGTHPGESCPSSPCPLSPSPSPFPHKRR
jgi:hypothetical protein